MPYLTAAQVLNDYTAGVNPITIYPETIGSNIFGSPVSYEYLLNFKKALRQGEAESKMMTIAYSEVIRRLTPGCQQTLFIPTSDSDFFSPSDDQERSRDVYFYAAKYQLLTGKKPELPEPAIEIQRTGPDAPDREALRDIYRRAKRIYVFENSAVANEAALCGCPVVLMRSDFFQNNITEVELGMQGMTWNADAASISEESRRVDGFRRVYLDSYNLSARQLQVFLEASQARAAASSYTSPMALPFLQWRRRWEMIVDGVFRLDNRIRR